MRVLVLGGAGFIGRHAAAALAARGHAVVIGTRRPRRRLPRLVLGYEVLETHLERLATRGEWHVLLTLRTHLVESHKGQVSFPGGRVDPTDTSRVDTALREIIQTGGGFTLDRASEYVDRLKTQKRYQRDVY